MGKKLYIGNLSFQVSEEDLAAKLGEFGTVTSAKLIMDRETGRSKGFAFVEMGSEEEAQKAIDAMDGQDFAGRQTRVNIAIEKERR